MANLTEIEAFLRKRRMGFEIVGEDGREDVVKTLIARTNDGFVALCLRLQDRVDFKLVRTEFGNRSELASAEEVKEVAGVPVGAVCPVLLDVPIYVDENVMELDEVEMGSGEIGKSLKMRLEDLLKVIKYEVMELRKND